MQTTLQLASWKKRHKDKTREDATKVRGKKRM